MTCPQILQLTERLGFAHPCKANVSGHRFISRGCFERFTVCKLDHKCSLLELPFYCSRLVDCGVRYGTRSAMVASSSCFQDW